MKKYTIVYADWWSGGGHQPSITRLARIETANLKQVLATYEVWFVLDGWPEQIKEWA